VTLSIASPGNKPANVNAEEPGPLARVAPGSFVTAFAVIVNGLAVMFAVIPLGGTSV
jgi:hypothetical protein